MTRKGGDHESCQLHPQIESGGMTGLVTSSLARGVQHGSPQSHPRGPLHFFQLLILDVPPHEISAGLALKREPH